MYNSVVLKACEKIIQNVQNILLYQNFVELGSIVWCFRMWQTSKYTLRTERHTKVGKSLYMYTNVCQNFGRQTSLYLIIVISAWI